MNYARWFVIVLGFVGTSVYASVAIEARADAARWRARYIASVFEQRDMLTRLHALRCDEITTESERVRALESVR